MTMKKIIQHLCTVLNDGEDLVLVSVSSQSGSTPRQDGAKMAVRHDGRIAGTIGGGVMEAQAIKEAQKCFADSRSRHLTFDLSSSEAATTDMICGGRMELFLEFIQGNEDNRTFFQSLNAAMASGQRITLICPLDAVNGGRRFFIDHRGQASHDDVPETLLATIKKLDSSHAATSLIRDEGKEYLVSHFGVGGNLFLIGAGHVAACTAEAAARVGFRIIVLDDRSEFANKNRFPDADKIEVLPSFADCFTDFYINEDCYLVIVTRGHNHDQEVLDQALQTKAGYIGMIGSRKKRNAIYANLMKKGIKETQLEKVHCPIGLAIEADTPEEIAVSIVGELIHHRAAGRKAWHLV